MTNLETDKINVKVSVAALVLFGNAAAIRELLPSAECVFEYRAKGSSGAADERISYREAFFSFYDKLWDRINVRNTKQHYQDGLFVMDIPLFNERVVREALLNAVAHRNYQMQGYVLVRQYPETLNIESPGGFPYGVTSDTILDCSLPRNRLIAEIFECAGLVRDAGLLEMKGKGKATYYVPGDRFPVAKHETTPPQAQTTPPQGQTTAPLPVEVITAEEELEHIKVALKTALKTALTHRTRRAHSPYTEGRVFLYGGSRLPTRSF